MSMYNIGMAVTFDQIKEVRLRINDPEGFANVISVADPTTLPVAPAPYTAYRVESTGAYVSTTLESGATASDYSTLSIYLSDARIETWIETEDEDFAECRALQAISVKLGGELRLKRNTSGAETTEYITLKELYQYYKALSDDCKERRRKDNKANTGRYVNTKNPTIAGGNI